MLFGAAAALQAPRGQHLPGEPGGRAGQGQHGKADLLLAAFAGEAGPDRGVSVPAGLEGHQPEAVQVCGDCDGVDGFAADGVPRADSEFVCGELFADGAEAAGGHEPDVADYGDELVCAVCEY
uniref:(northern house mosquito) hypothetical protein n=1 Tax=Culex pipiens TaxID=7175 RepID=A0A8D8L8D3_CULPI